MTKEELAKQINGAAVCCCIMETVLKAGKKLWTVPNYLASQAREAQRKAQVRKDLGKDKERKMVSYGKNASLSVMGSYRWLVSLSV